MAIIRLISLPKKILLSIRNRTEKKIDKLQVVTDLLAICFLSNF